MGEDLAHNRRVGEFDVETRDQSREGRGGEINLEPIGPIFKGLGYGAGSQIAYNRALSIEIGGLKLLQFGSKEVRAQAGSNRNACDSSAAN